VAVKIAVLSDTHIAQGSPLPERRSDIAQVLLLRAVHRLNRLIKPDVTVVLGDVLDDSTAPDAADLLRRAKDTLALLTMPVIVIPGNHDGDMAAFYDIFERPPEFVDIKGVRFAWFTDVQEPRWNATRTDADMQRMARSRAGWSGPIVVLQHVPIFLPGACDCPFNYTNADEVIAGMRRAGISLAISGHYHAGIDIVRADGLTTVIAPALCESSFSFLEVNVDCRGGSPSPPIAEVRRHHLRMPDELGLIDCHAHTQFAYCCENMEIGRAIALAKDFGLAGIRFTEHSGQLYFEEKTYWRAEFMQNGLAYPHGRQMRFDHYLQAAKDADVPAGCIGTEAECDFHGRPVLRPEDREKVSFVIGGLHVLPELMKPQRDPAKVADEFMAATDRFVRSGIEVLAHPFRIFRRNKLEAPAGLFEPVVRLLKENGVAAEINYHTNDPSPEFARLCIDMGVKLTFGSDSHNLYEIGEFSPHLDLLRRAGYDGEVRDVLAARGMRRST